MRAIEIRRLVCPTDFSPFSERALQLGVSIARWYGAGLTVIHVRVPAGPRAAASVAAARRVAGCVDDPLAAEVRALARRAAKLGVRADAVLAVGDATREILACATRLSADLVVMGTHGRSGFERWALGSVAEKVLRKAACPVLSVGPGCEPSLSWGSILCAVDFSALSRVALAYARSFAAATGARLQALHVVEGAPPFEAHDHPGIDLAAYRRWLIEEALESLHEAVSEGAAAEGDVDESVTFGKAYAEILRVARESGAGLVVLGARGRAAVDLALFGSTTNQVVRSAGCPVLTVTES